MNRAQPGLVISLSAAILLAVVPSSAAQAKAPGQEERARVEWLTEKMNEANSIKPGMSKADVLKVFMKDGGLQPYSPQRFVLQRCTMIKVDVTFDVPDGADLRPITMDSQVKIKSISKPYLEPMFLD